MENETRKLNEEWQERVNQLMMQHDAEKNCMRQFYDDSRELLREFVMGKFKAESEELASKAVAEAKIEMDKKCSEQVDSEIARQSFLFQEQMENTLKNLEINDKDRMEEMKRQCLNAMDIQSHLMLCRQITEMMHMMFIEKKHWRKKMESQRKPTELESEGKLLKKYAQHNQSKSIKYLLTEFMQELNDLDVEALDGDDEKIYQEIHQICRKFKRQKVDELEKLLIIEEPTVGELSKNNFNLDWIEMEDSNKNIENRPPFIDVKWEKFEIDNSIVQIQDNVWGSSFASSVFDRFTQPQDSIHPNASSDIAQVISSIIEIVNISKDDKQLQEKNIAAKIHDVIMKKVPTVDPLAAAVDIVPMPKVETVSIKDSLETLEKRVS